MTNSRSAAPDGGLSSTALSGEGCDFQTGSLSGLSVLNTGSGTSSADSIGAQESATATAWYLPRGDPLYDIDSDINLRKGGSDSPLDLYAGAKIAVTRLRSQ